MEAIRLMNRCCVSDSHAKKIQLKKPMRIFRDAQKRKNINDPVRSSFESVYLTSCLQYVVGHPVLRLQGL